MIVTSEQMALTLALAATAIANWSQLEREMNENDYYSLNEAISLLAFGEKRSAADELTLRARQFDDVRRLLSASRAEAERYLKYKNFRRLVPEVFTSLDVLASRLIDSRHYWPPRAADLYNSVLTTQHIRCAYLGQYESSWLRIQNGAAAKSGTFASRILIGHETSFVEIKAEAFSRRLSLDKTLTCLVRISGRDNDVDEPQLVASDVHVRVAAVECLLRNPALEKPVGEEEYCNWYSKIWVPRNVDDGNRPRLEDEKKAAEDHFLGRKVSREIVRYARRTYCPPDWKSAGRHRNRAKK